MHHIMQRCEAKSAQNWDDVATQNKLIKQSVRQDRAAWLHDLLKAGDWIAVQKIRKHGQFSNRKLHDASGRVLHNHERAEGFAKHLEQIQ